MWLISIWKDRGFPTKWIKVNISCRYHQIYSTLLWQKGEMCLDSNSIFYFHFDMPKVYVTSLYHIFYFYLHKQFRKLIWCQIQDGLKNHRLKKWKQKIRLLSRQISSFKFYILGFLFLQLGKKKKKNMIFIK